MVILIEYVSSLPNWKKKLDTNYPLWYEWEEGDGQQQVIRIYTTGIPSWELHRWTDSDMETEWGPQAVARYVQVDEGETVEELKAALAQFKA